MTPLTAVSDRDFARFQALIRQEAGIFLAPAKKALLQGRLARRIRDLGIDTFGAYFDRVVHDEAERIWMLDAICTNETHFFREPRHFEYLARRVVPALCADAEAGRRSRQVRAWSAACSTGEEACSLAMTLLAALPGGWDVRVLGTDLSTKVLAQAADGVYSMDKAGEIPEPYLKAFMLRGHGTREGFMKAGPEIRAVVRFERMNLAAATWPAVGQFDLVFLRNVLIYFDRETKGRVVTRALASLAPGGQLFLGHAESLAGMMVPSRPVFPTVYAREAPARAEEAVT